MSLSLCVLQENSERGQTGAYPRQQEPGMQVVFRDEAWVKTTWGSYNRRLQEENIGIRHSSPRRTLLISALKFSFHRTGSVCHVPMIHAMCFSLVLDIHFSPNNRNSMCHGLCLQMVSNVLQLCIVHFAEVLTTIYRRTVEMCRFHAQWSYRMLNRYTLLLTTI